MGRPGGTNLIEDIESELGTVFYRDMQRIRMVEEEIALRYADQEMRCPVHLSIGQEGVAVGICSALEKKDQIVCSHRCHGQYLAKGGNLVAMLAEIYGRVTGCCGGRGGSMHLYDMKAGVLASVPIVASSIPLGVGAALASKQRGESSVSVAFLGDGSAEEGVFHESANFASVHNLPVIFVVENNLFSVYTHLDQRQPNRELTKLAGAHGLECHTADGNDVIQVFNAAKKAVKKARTGGGSSMIFLDTYRWLEHCGPNYDNDLGYRTLEEFEAWKKRCPVQGLERKLVDNGLLDQARINSIRSDIELEVRRAFSLATSANFPLAEDGRRGVYAE